MGVPGWPHVAFWTASMESVRMLLIDSCSILTVDVGIILLSANL